MNDYFMSRLANDRAQALRAEADRQRLARRLPEARGRRHAPSSLVERLGRGLHLGRVHA